MKCLTNLSKREKYLLKDSSKEHCSSEIENFILDCSQIALSGQSLIVFNKETEYLLSNYREKFLLSVSELCNTHPKSKTSIIDVIIGPLGAGKSKVIKRNLYMENSFKADADKIKEEVA